MDFFRNENLWLYLPLILWISGIFYLSSNKGSITNTSRFLSPIFKIIFPDEESNILKTYHLYLRKLCHFLGYGVLAWFAILVFYHSSVPFLAKFWYIFSFAVVIVIASADEFKQSFYANRVGSFSDVMLDGTGGLTMILLFWLYTIK